nr:hypothetical protein [Corynebacterium diphtheriae]
MHVIWRRRKESYVTSSTNNSSNPAFVITFVCTGNICRSPMSEVICTSVFRRRGVKPRYSC